MLRRILFPAVLLFVTLLPPSNARAQCTRTWQGGIDNLWFNEMNWTPTGVPGATDDVCIFSGSPLLSVDEEYTIHSLTLGEPGSAVIAELTYTESAFIGTPLFHLLANSTINPAGRLIWQNGPWDTADGTAVTNLGEILLETDGGKVLDGALFINQGIVTRNGGRLHLNNNSTFINEATFVWDGGNAVDSDGVGTNTFVNAATGVFRHTDAATGVVFVNDLNVENEGLFDAESGDIQFAGNSTHTDAVFEAGVDGEINFGGVVNETGLHTFVGTITGTPAGVIRFTANGTGAVTAGPGGATLAFGGTGLEWRNGTVSGVGGGTMTNIGLITMPSTAFGDRFLTDGILFVNQADMLWSGQQTFISGGATLRNESVFELQADVNLKSLDNGTFVNTAAGSYVKSGGLGSSLIGAGLTFDNQGLLESQTGVIDIDGNSVHTDAVITAAAGATVRFDEGTHTIAGTVTGTPDGTVLLNGTTAVLVAAPGGTLDFGGAGFQWGGGILDSPDPITNAGLMVIVGSGFGEPQIENGTILVNLGTVQWTVDRLNVDGGSVIQNDGLWDVQADLDLRSDGGGVFLNTATGTFRKSGGAAESMIEAGMTFDNHGLVESLSGDIEFLGNSIHTDAVITAAAGAEVRFEEGIHTLTGTVTGAPDGDVKFTRGLGAGPTLEATAGGTLAFGGTGFQWLGGTVDSPETVTNAGLMVIGAAGFSDPIIAGGTTLVNQGTLNWTGDRLHLDGASTLRNEGLIDVQADLSMDSDGGGVFENAGTFRKSGGAGSFVFLPNTTVENLAGGVVDAAAGRIDFDGTAFNRAGATVQGIARVDVSGGTFTNEGTFAPGASPGILAYTGDYDMTAATTVLAVELAGLTLETEYDQLDVSGTAALGGSLDGALLDGFFPAVGDAFVILTADGGVSGAFTNTSTDDRVYIGSGLVFDILYNPNDVTLVADLLEADYAVTKTVDTTTVVVGDTVTFTVAITNDGPHDLTDFNRDAALRVTDVLPAGLTLVAATPSAGTYDAGTGLWELETLAVGASETLTLAATVDAEGTFTNTATLTGSELPDPNDANDAASVAVTAVAPGPAVTITLTPLDPPIVIPPEGGRFGFEIAVTNHTDDTRTVDLWLTLTGPGVDFERGPRGTTLAPGATLEHHVGITVPAIAEAGTYTVTMAVGTFPTPDESDAFTFEKTAGATADGGTAWRVDFEVDSAEGRMRGDAASGAKSGAPAVTAAGTTGADLPGAFALAQNYPNPFNPTTTIPFEVAETARVTIRVYDVVGREVAVLVDREFAPGRYRATWDGRDRGGQAVASGVYLYRMQAGTFARTLTLTLIK